LREGGSSHAQICALGHEATVELIQELAGNAPLFNPATLCFRDRFHLFIIVNLKPGGNNGSEPDLPKNCLAKLRRFRSAEKLCRFMGLAEPEARARDRPTSSPI
jgi:hypothetical protein